jgi:hypothetical protein
MYSLSYTRNSQIKCFWTHVFWYVELVPKNISEPFSYTLYICSQYILALETRVYRNNLLRLILLIHLFLHKDDTYMSTLIAVQINDIRMLHSNRDTLNL